MASIESLDVRPIDAAHSDDVWPLSIEAGWNQNVADWRFMLGAGRGFGCVGPDGSWQASSLVLPLGQKLAWISMVLVTRDRRRGKFTFEKEAVSVLEQEMPITLEKEIPVGDRGCQLSFQEKSGSILE